MPAFNIKILGNWVYKFWPFFWKNCSKLNLLNWKENINKEEIRETFKAFDKEDTGYINAKELKMVMTNLSLKVTDEEIQEMMKFTNLDN